jgi:CRP/FNR family cyclic AMP-dependent transcriptional regulator
MRRRFPLSSKKSTPDTTAVQVRQTFEKNFAEGDVVFEEGDPGDVLFIIQSGEIELTRRGLAERRAVANLGPGEFFGEMSVVLGENRTARASAVCEARLLQLDGATLEAMCMERPEIGIRIISRLTARLIDSERRLASLGVDDLLRPVVRALVRRAESPVAGEGVRIPGNLRDVAHDAGLSMLEAHHALHQLLDQKRLRLIDDVLVAQDLDSLVSSVELSE